MASNRKHKLVTALCKELSIDPNQFLGNLERDTKSLCIDITSSSPQGAALAKDSEFMRWVEFADKFPEDSELCFKALGDLNEELVKISVLLGKGFTHSAADVIVFSIVHPHVIGLSKEDQEKLPHLLRWMDYIQNKADAASLFESIKFDKVEFIHPEVKMSKGEVGSNIKNPEPGKKEGGSSGDVKLKKPSDSEVKILKGEGGSNAKAPKPGKKEHGNLEDVKSKEHAELKKVTGDNDKKNTSVKEVDEKDKDISVSLLKIQIGHIRKAWKHPSADSLLVEEIDVGEAKCRQVVSGLAKYFTPEELTNRRIVLITNMKPSKLRDVVSEGMVLCASNDDHTVVEPLIAPEGANIGEFVSFQGHDGKPEDVLNPKKKQFDKIAVNLYTDEKGVATFKGVPFTTSAGPCTSSLPNASIK
ncbi:hypothetical protein DM860_010834 [Cuscuta australis]|uniref:tRNA-binding domain-containing protein n=1 Tax=Cuscuta australis TaxID=267555 RepID=A0A328E030_9ASTE|nr:hypothetical protein DM860_010834 [Cuscuta australis]